MCNMKLLEPHHRKLSILAARPFTGVLCYHLGCVAPEPEDACLAQLVLMTTIDSMLPDAGTQLGASVFGT